MSLYCYEGTLSSIQYHKNPGAAIGWADVILRDNNDDAKPPIRLETHGALAEYLNKRCWTDEEERYLPQRWYYDGNLFLRRVEVLEAHGIAPAKIITTDGPLSDMLLVFGPQELIDTRRPEAMTKTEATRMADYIYSHQDWWYRR